MPMYPLGEEQDNRKAFRGRPGKRPDQRRNPADDRPLREEVQQEDGHGIVMLGGDGNKGGQKAIVLPDL